MKKSIMISLLLASATAGALEGKKMKTRGKWRRLLLGMVLLAHADAIAQGLAEINISFQKTAATAAALDPSSAPANAGVLVGPAFETWNAATTETLGMAFSAVPLRFSDGTTAPATLSAQLGYAHESNLQPWTDKDHVVMDSWVGIKGSEFITVQNLPSAFAANGYTVFIHGDSSVAGRFMAYTLAGRTQTIEDNFTFSGDHADTMLAFGNLTATSFTITGNAAVLSRSAINALRIVPNPPQSIHIAFQKTIAHRDALAAGNPPGPGAIVDSALAAWNSVTTDADGSTPSGLVLQWADGTPSPITLSANYGYAMESNNGVDPATLSSKDAVLFDAWIGLKDNETVTVAGIPASLSSRGYQVVLFGDAGTDLRQMDYAVAGRTQTIHVAESYAGDPRPFTLVWRDLTGPSFTLSGNAATLKRSAVCGLRILPNDLPVLPSIASFRADDLYVDPGSMVTLSWTAQNADALAIDGGVGDVTSLTSGGSGSTTLIVHADTTLTLCASNAWGETRATVDLRAGPPRPNLVVVLIDDMGLMDSSEPFIWDGEGNPVLHATMPYRTPQMERMADMGMKFPSAYAMSVCSPSRTSLLTGKNSLSHGLTDWVNGSIQKEAANTNPVLDPPPDWLYQGVLDNEILLTTMLSEVGYRNLMVGKTHWGRTNDPFSAGFHRAIGYAAGSDKLSYFGLPGLAKYDGTGTYVTEALTQEMNGLLAEAVGDGVPFFAYVSHFAVHSAHQLDPRFEANYPGLSGTALNFATMIEGIDKSLGDVLDELEALGVAENTLVVFLSDNGSDAPIGAENSPPLRGRKGTEWEGGSRVPLLVAWAKSNPSNPFQQAFPVRQDVVRSELVTIYDLFPTLLEIADVPFSHAIDGQSLVPYLADIPGTHRPQEHLLHYPHNHRGEFYSFLRQEDWKLIFYYETASFQLYNLAEDAGETIDRMAGEPERTMAMARRMAMLLNESGALWPVAESDGSRHPFLMPWLPEVDTDGDGIPDNTEDPNRNGLVDPGETDPDNPDSDNDGTSDGAEIRLGLDPLDPASFFELHGSVGTNRNFTLAWPSVPGNVFTVQANTDLGVAVWSDLAVNLPAGPGSNTVYDADPAGHGSQVFRIQLQPGSD